jgi:hypothetical protein
LARLFNNFDPADIGIERAQAIRDKALKMGIIDVLLTSLAHFSRQPNRLDPLRPFISEEQPMVYFLLLYMLALDLEISEIWNFPAAFKSHGKF